MQKVIAGCEYAFKKPIMAPGSNAWQKGVLQASVCKGGEGTKCIARHQKAHKSAAPSLDTASSTPWIEVEKCSAALQQPAAAPTYYTKQFTLLLICVVRHQPDHCL